MRCPEVHRLLNQPPHLARAQPAGQRIERHHPSGVNQFLGQRLVLRGLKDLYPLIEAHLAAEHQLRIGAQLLRQIGLIKPNNLHIPGLIADNGLGGAPSPEKGLMSLPHRSDDGLFLPYLELGNGLTLAVIDVAPGEEVEHIAHRAHAQAAELGR